MFFFLFFKVKVVIRYYNVAGFVFFFFFFQAEDGIRDYKVTGVQTCALPIFSSSATFPGLFAVLRRGVGLRSRWGPSAIRTTALWFTPTRSFCARANASVLKDRKSVV